MTDDLSGLTLVELLDLLEPVPEPAPVSLWPQTAGWIWLGVIIAAVAVFLVWRWMAIHRANAYRRAALKEITGLGDDPAALAAVLRRTALAAYPRGSVAGLHGEAWLGFLDHAYDGTGFRDGPGRAVAIAPYGPAQAAPGLAALVARWVRTHRRQDRAA